MKVKKLLKLIEEQIKTSNMLGCCQYGIALKVIEDLLWNQNKSELASKANKIQHIIIFKESE